MAMSADRTNDTFASLVGEHGRVAGYGHVCGQYRQMSPLTNSCVEGFSFIRGQYTQHNLIAIIVRQHAHAEGYYMSEDIKQSILSMPTAFTAAKLQAVFSL